jgi:signal transduction histidine kinase
MVSGDPGRLRQVLTNFFVNASKFTQTGEIVLRASHEISAGESVVRFEVSETGDAIAPGQAGCDIPTLHTSRHVHLEEMRAHRTGSGHQSQLVALMSKDCGASSVLK